MVSHHYLYVGGIQVNEKAGSRVKTAGGVFIQLLKNCEHIPEETRAAIFKEEKIGRKEEKKLASDLSKALSLF